MNGWAITTVRFRWRGGRCVSRQDARVFEINGPSDWHGLCVRYQARGTEDDRLVPNWGAVSEEWDGVHLSLGGLLTTEQGRYESPAGWTMLESWHAEQT